MCYIYIHVYMARGTCIRSVYIDSCSDQPTQVNKMSDCLCSYAASVSVDVRQLIG